ncbi:hypothetical protein CY34DRAFT_356249 [Suillus luteus UH-Slu-Lm8-n1]|uniref:Uncharacterized protein n=1 Tax=Suillus luteus UH-Slu-Lm8-n1 TaxID=930992 RepID=A0A0D0BAS9_9AGAM|nr:hypothetical protein CY34DRAFT_356249 [Suillus luteus UH-Slu-Lm8-n1]
MKGSRENVREGNTGQKAKTSGLVFHGSSAHILYCQKGLPIFALRDRVPSRSVKPKKLKRILVFACRVHIETYVKAGWCIFQLDI